MKLLKSGLVKKIGRIYTELLYRIEGPVKAKARYELAFWRQTAKQGPLVNGHYRIFAMDYFGLDAAFYQGKKILDIGCGPAGSLEWADMASERIGLEPLAKSYRKLGIEQHKMSYVASPSESIPFADEYFDVVSSFNSLDHVDDLDQTISEITRVIAAGGLFLLIVAVNHEPTFCEPIAFSWEVVEKFQPTLELTEERHFEYSIPNDMYQSIRKGIEYDHNNQKYRKAVLAAKFTKPI